MELLDPNKIPEGEKLDFSIDAETRKKLLQQHKDRNIDLVNQIAFYEHNISRYVNEQSMCEQYGITLDQLKIFKKSHRDEIEQCKDEHKYGKFKIVKHIGKKMALHDSMVQARIEGNDEIAEKLKSILTESEKVLPMGEVREMAETLKLIDESEVKVGSAQQININLSSDLNKAQEAFEKRMKEKIVDIPSNGKS